MQLNREQIFEAKDFLESEFYKVLYDKLSNKYIKEFAESEYEDWDTREKAYRMLQALAEFDKQLRIFVDSLKFDR